jgi:hypothetical protein
MHTEPSLPVDGSGSDAVIGELPPVSLEDRDLSVEDIVQRAARTDDYLRRWRTESVDRRADWEAAEAERLAEEAVRQGWFRLGAAGGLFAAVCLAGIGLWMTGSGSTEVVPEVRTADAPVVAAVEAAPVEAAPVEAAPVEAAPVEAAPAVQEPVVEPVEEPVVEAAEEPVAAPVAQGPQVIDGKVWTSGSYAWAEAFVAAPGAELAWFDRTGAEALDRVACDGVVDGGFKCYSGRSHARMAYAIDQGAAPGEWTVKVCQGADCTALGQVATP